MKFTDAKSALNWMLNHPLKGLYNEYGNYYLWGPYSNTIEYWHFLGDWEDEDGNLYPGDWDMDRWSADEFLELNKVELESQD